MPDRFPLLIQPAVDLVRAGPARLGAVKLVAIDGPSGSGKTTVAAALAAALVEDGLSVEIFATDLLATWDDPFGWWPRLESGVLGPLAHGRTGAIRINDWSTGAPRPGAIQDIAVPQVLVLEGVSAGRLAVATRLTALIWVEIPDRAVRLDRAVARDGEAIRPQLLAWQRAEEAHFSVDAARDRANLRIDPTGDIGHRSRSTVPQT